MKKSVHGSIRPVSKIRLAEILFRSAELLNIVETTHYKEFARRYSLNVKQGLALLKQVGSFVQTEELSIPVCKNVLSQIPELDDYAQLSQQGHLSIYDQLLQILARWRVHRWILLNQNFIVWAYRRREYLSSLLTKYAGNPILLKGDLIHQTLPAIDIVWLVDLVGPLVVDQAEVSLSKIPSKLSRPAHAESLLRISAQLNQMNTFVTMLSPIEEDTVEDVFQYFQKRKPMFKALLSNNEEIFDDFINSNPHVEVILDAIRENKGRLVRFLNLRDDRIFKRKQAALDYFRPLIENLQQLKSCIMPIDTMITLEVLQFFKSKQNLFAAIVFNYNACNPAFKSYVEANPQADDLIKRLRSHAERINTLLRIQDVRAIITNPELKEYFRPLVNDLMSEYIRERLKMLVKFAGINRQWSARDQGVVWVLTCLERYRDEIRHLVSDNKTWKSWIKNNLQYKTVGSEFRKALIQCVEGPIELSENSFIEGCNEDVVRGCVDVRPGKSRAFVPIRTCLLEALGDLTEDDTVNVEAKDVLLFNLVSHPQNNGLFVFLFNNVETIQPMLAAFQDDQNNHAEVNVQPIEPAVLIDMANQPGFVEVDANARLDRLDNNKRIRFDFQQDQRRLVEEDENQVASTVTVRSH